MDNNIYSDIAKRTQGDIYIGVVGPVRSGKSTFIKRFMDLVVLPNIENDYKRERAMDELPQSAGGRMIMTTEPKFIPNEAVEISFGNTTSCKMRMIDCVGYIVPSALGHIEDDMPRMVRTPWSDEPMPFAKAAEMGTEKVISEHSTVGVVVTTDGTITDIPREDYIEAESRVISELLALKKPFVVIMNTTKPSSPKVLEYSKELEEKWGVKVLPLNCMSISAEDISDIMEKVLFEFPLKELGINIPGWVESLPETHPLRVGIRETVLNAIPNIFKISDVTSLPKTLADYEYIEGATTKGINAGEGVALLDILVPDECFYQTVHDVSGFEIRDKQSLMTLMQELSDIKHKYDKISAALTEVAQKGYGIVSPGIDELTLEEPEIVKQGSRFGVRLKASAPSIHMIRADIQTEVSPIVGTERQSEELVHYLLNEFEQDPKKIWESNIFGKSLHELVNEGLHNKLNRMPEDAQMKLQETLQRIINEGSGGLICIIL